MAPFPTEWLIVFHKTVVQQDSIKTLHKIIINIIFRPWYFISREEKTVMHRKIVS